MPLIEHLKELRARLMACIFSIIVFSVVSFIFWHRTNNLLLPGNVSLIYISPQEALMAKMKLSFFCGLLLSLPVIFFEFWKFIVPALTIDERKFYLFLGMLSFLLFFCGVFFGIFIITPALIKFFLKFSQPSLMPLFSIANYSSLVINIAAASGLAFQMPVIMMLAAAGGLLDRESMARYRGHAVILIFIVAAVITPPDAFSQIALALPMWGLYELGLVLTIFIKKKRQET
ncbi:MAG: twin-arginine translocase subunit TatC [Tepidanaerobacteraceae bacterium]|nr:twin-arginine translocase subunit TatC [Tepidanaerobacteraceae bacterium]